MNDHTVLIIVVCVLSLLIIAFFALFRGKGKFSIKTKLVEVTAEGTNPPAPTSVAGGVRIEDAYSGRVIHAESAGPGGVNLKKVKAGESIKAISSLGDPPYPKK